MAERETRRRLLSRRGGGGGGEKRRDEDRRLSVVVAAAGERLEHAAAAAAADRLGRRVAVDRRAVGRARAEHQHRPHLRAVRFQTRATGHAGIALVVVAAVAVRRVIAVAARRIPSPEQKS